jgi:hypothetical protein
MSCPIYYNAQAYWQIASRYHTNRGKSAGIGRVAVKDMGQLQVRGDATRRRVNAFIEKHGPRKPVPPFTPGPRFA